MTPTQTATYYPGSPIWRAKTSNSVPHTSGAFTSAEGISTARGGFKGNGSLTLSDEQSMRNRWSTEFQSNRTIERSTTYSRKTWQLRQMEHKQLTAKGRWSRWSTKGSTHPGRCGQAWRHNRPWKRTTASNDQTYNDVKRPNVQRDRTTWCGLVCGLLLVVAVCACLPLLVCLLGFSNWINPTFGI